MGLLLFRRVGGGAAERDVEVVVVVVVDRRFILSAKARAGDGAACTCWWPLVSLFWPKVEGSLVMKGWCFGVV